MPLLHKKKFELMELPENLEPDEKVFCCSITNEIFRDYEIFYDRTILYNSLVWSCDITGKPNLTYQEALNSEEKALKKINLIPDVLKKPIFVLVSFVKRSKIDHLKDTIFDFIKDRYFINEEVEVTVGKLRRSDCTILDWQRASQSNDETDKEAGNEKDKHSETALNSSEIEYIVRYGKGTDSKVMQLSSLCIRRKAGVLTRQHCRLLLKANCYKPNKSASENYHIKEEVLRSYNLINCSWDKYFAGTPPSFKVDKDKNKKNSAASSGE